MAKMQLEEKKFQFQLSQVIFLKIKHKKEILSNILEIYKTFCLDMAQGLTNGAPNETQNYSCRFARLAC